MEGLGICGGYSGFGVIFWWMCCFDICLDIFGQVGFVYLFLFMLVFVLFQNLQFLFMVGVIVVVVEFRIVVIVWLYVF